MFSHRNFLTQATVAVVCIVLANAIGYYFYKRFDLTHDKRYTLSKASVAILKKIDRTVIVDVLLKGNLTPEFQKLQQETRQLLEEFSDLNSKIKFSFIDPLKDEKNPEALVQEMSQMGLSPTSVTSEESGTVSQTVIFPWALVNIEKKTLKVSLLKNKLGATSEELVNNSIQQLEYAFVEALHTLSTKNKKKIAITRSNGELSDVFLADFLTTVKSYYKIAPFVLDSVKTNPQGTLDALKNFDLVCIAKPSKPFSEAEKQVLDQYIMSGGRMLLLADYTTIDMDSLMSIGAKLATRLDLNLDDLLFRYGIRINTSLVKDLNCSPIVIAQGEGTKTQYNPIPWQFSPLVISKNNHPINNNIEALKFEFANSIDTLKNGTKKQILLTSSAFTKTVTMPNLISLESAFVKPQKETYDKGRQTLAVLLEGRFISTYKNRVKPITLKNQQDQSVATKLIVIADGDLIKNQVKQGVPLELGYDKWTNNFYGNKEFLLNCMNYLLDDSGIINVRSKVIEVPFLDKQKTIQYRTLWQTLCIVTPLALLGLFGVVFVYSHKKKYTANVDKYL